uniref:Gamma-interferon-inducible lysosomal thiol reductase n=1 Tax=Panagrellus redivivus TaxID=6233 RepID=A0A7E4WDL4_PANRE
MKIWIGLIVLLAVDTVGAWRRRYKVYIPAKEIVDTQSGNSVHIAVYMEAQCPDTSRFIKKHLVPTWQRLRSTGRVEIALVPFGKARCERVGDDFKCDCQHGSNECELNQLMNCAINEFNFADHYVPLIGCIQGSNNVNAAIEKCIQKGHYNQYTDRLRECATGPRGRHLLALAGQKTTALSPPLTFVPWVMLDGARSTDAYWALEENVCKLLDPQPPECQPVMAAAKAAAARI